MILFLNDDVEHGFYMCDDAVDVIQCAPTRAELKTIMYLAANRGIMLRDIMQNTIITNPQQYTTQQPPPNLSMRSRIHIFSQQKKGAKHRGK